VSVPLTVIEQIVSSSGVATAIEQMLPAGVRERQLKASTLLIGMMLALAVGRPAHLTRVPGALLALPEDDQKRLSVIAQWKNGPHPLTCRQAGHTHRLITKALAKTEPGGAPSAGLPKLCDQLLEASIPPQFKDTSSSLAAGWTDPEARWGHRNAGRAIEEGEMFFGYYMPAAVMVNDENGPAVPELARRITVCSSAPRPRRRPRPGPAGHGRGRHPARRHPGRLRVLPPPGINMGRPAPRSRRRTGAGPAPHDRGPQGTHQGATPRPHLDRHTRQVPRLILPVVS
jgi:hypothetical protein